MPYIVKVFKGDWEGGEGLKIPKNLSTWFVDGPLFKNEAPSKAYKEILFILYAISVSLPDLYWRRDAEDFLC